MLSSSHKSIDLSSKIYNPKTVTVDKTARINYSDLKKVEPTRTVQRSVDLTARAADGRTPFDDLLPS